MTVARETRVPAQLVANAFIQQYYHIQHLSPGLVHRFYQEESKLGRPDDDGTMSTTTTLQAINEKILSLNYGEYRADIIYVDAQESYNGGVHVLVSGYLERKDNMNTRNFTQTFFLAPQEKGYFVLNDVLRYVDDINHPNGNQHSNGDVGVPLSPEQDHFPVQEINVLEEENLSIEVNGDQAPPSENGEVSAVEEDDGEVSAVEEDDGDVSVVEEDDGDVSVVEEVPVSEVINEVPDESRLVVEAKPKSEEAPKRTYAWIVMDLKESSVQVSSPSPAPQRSVAKSQEQKGNVVQASTLVPETPVSGPDAVEDGKNREEEADGYSVYIKGLPYDATPAQLEDEFKRFGAIKSGGIQVRSNQQQGFSFGFVEFEVATAAQKAIEASPVTIGGRRAIVEEKRSTCSRGNGYRGRYASARSYGFRQDGNYGSVRGNGNNARGDFNGRPEFGGYRGNYRGGFSSRDGYQRAGNNSGSYGGRMNRGGAGMAANGTTKTVAPQVSATA